MHGIRRDHRASQVEQVNQLLHGGDLVRLVLHRLQRQAHFNPHTQAETECEADFPEAWSNEPRSVLPSKATVSPFIRLMVAEQNTPSISRAQLQIRLKTLSSVQLSNPSRNRAVAICGCEVLEAGETRDCELPVKIHLQKEMFLRVSTSPSMGLSAGMRETSRDK